MDVSVHSFGRSARQLARPRAFLLGLRHVDRIPLPGFALVRRESLAPDRPLRIANVPAEHHDDWLAFVNVSREEVTDLVSERTDDGWIERARLAVRPIDAP